MIDVGGVLRHLAINRMDEAKRVPLPSSRRSVLSIYCPGELRRTIRPYQRNNCPNRMISRSLRMETRHLAFIGGLPVALDSWTGPSPTPCSKTSKARTLRDEFRDLQEADGGGNLALV